MKKKNLVAFEKRLGIISMMIVLMLSGILIIYYSWSKQFDAQTTAELTTTNVMLENASAVIPQQSVSGLYRLKGEVENTKEVRSLKEYYAIRAYPGAPPAIPHPVNHTATDKNTGHCLACHQNGGFVPKWNRFAPITPHPSLTQCEQCHVEQQAIQPFVNSSFTAVTPPKLKNKLLLSSPAPIPHGLEMRENCASCHGIGAPAELRSPHPEEKLCTQCHVEQSTN